MENTKCVFILEYFPLLPYWVWQRRNSYLSEIRPMSAKSKGKRNKSAKKNMLRNSNTIRSKAIRNEVFTDHESLYRANIQLRAAYGRLNQEYLKYVGFLNTVKDQVHPDFKNKIPGMHEISHLGSDSITANSLRNSSTFERSKKLSTEQGIQTDPMVVETPEKPKKPVQVVRPPIVIDLVLEQPQRPNYQIDE